MERENKQYEIEYKAILDKARKNTHDENMFQAYAFPWERCAKSMKNKITSRKVFQDEIYNNPITLLVAIKKHSLNYQDTQYKMTTISDTKQEFFNTKQKKNEPHQDFTRQFRTSKEIMESNIGTPLLIPKYARTLANYKNSMKEYEVGTKNAKEQNVYDDKWTKYAANKLYTYIYLENADQSKYGTVFKTSNQQKSFGNNQYPRRIMESNNIIIGRCKSQAN